MDRRAGFGPQASLLRTPGVSSGSYIFFSLQPKQTKKSLTINFHGSLLLQQLLKFKNCGSISTGFLALTPDDLVAMACDSAGSFLLEAFMASGASDKKKDKLIEKLKVNLAIVY